MRTAKATSFAVVLLCLGVLPAATLLLLIAAMGPAVARHVDVAAFTSGGRNFLRRATIPRGDSSRRRGLIQRSGAVRDQSPNYATSSTRWLCSSRGQPALRQTLSRSTSARWRSTRRRVGPDHPDVAASLENLASLYEPKCRYADAEPLFRRSLAIHEKALGPDHPDVAIRSII